MCLIPSLLAAVEGNVQFALGATCAGSGDVHVTDVVHGRQGGGRHSEEIGLIEFEQVGQNSLVSYPKSRA